MSEGHEVLAVEQDAKKVARITEELGSVCLLGDGCEAATLSEAGTERADMLIAVTDEDADNLVACQVAKHKFNVPRTIARINNPKNEILFKKLGVNVTVSVIDLILEHIEWELPTHPLTRLFSLEDKKMEVVEIKIPPTSPVIGKKLADISLPRGSLLSLIIRLGQPPQMPSKDTIIQSEDRILGVVPNELEADLLRVLVGVLGKEKKE